MAFLDELSSYGGRVHVAPEDECGRLDLPTALAAFALTTVMLGSHLERVPPELLADAFDLGFRVDGFWPAFVGGVTPSGTRLIRASLSGRE